MTAPRTLPVRRLLGTLALAVGTFGAFGAAAQELTVSAAASLSDALREVGRQFEAARPGVTLRFNFAASGVLLQQLAQGAPVDVLITADAETMDRAQAQKLVDPATRRDVAGNTLVLVAPVAAASPGAAAGSAPAVSTLADLATPAVRRIAVGKPASVPVGRYAQQALEAAGLLAALQPKVVPADSVRQALDYVARGEVDAAFVYRTDAALMADRVRVVQVVGGHAPVRYPAAVAADSRQAALARAFATYLLGAPAQQVFARYGFAPP